MIKSKNKYTKMQKAWYEKYQRKMSIHNHLFHDSNPDLKNILLGDITADADSWKGKTALEFGCGCGRNLDTLLNLAKWKRVDGVDIAAANINYCDKYLKDLGHSSNRFNLYVNNGINVDVLDSNEYDYIMSTIVLQHICVHKIRKSILTDLYRVLKPGGILSFQVALDSSDKSHHLNGHSNDRRQTWKNHVGYYDNNIDAEKTNGIFDFNCEKPEYMYEDLKDIGFLPVGISHEIRKAWEDPGHDNWIYFRAIK